ncbi:MAG: Gfo/Idh/MocA family oxidoreductase [Kiritimatiellae bacterium]|nr:Gfo/Idh/MocA family oxidoreductase [Kiritimatiellia bacterium]
MYSRRQFIGSGAAFIAASGRVFGAEAPSNRVRLAVVGCHEKGRGQQVMRSALQLPGVDVVSVCDVDARARDWAAAKVLEISGRAPRRERDLRKVLEDPTVDGVVLETPDHWHAWGAVMAMRAGKAVYVEKPVAFCPREGEKLLETQRATGMVLQVGSQRRSSKAYADAVAFLHGGALGAPKWAKCWYLSNRASIGAGREAPVPEWLDWDLWQGPAPRTAYRDNVVHYNWHWFRRWGTAETGNNMPHYADVARWALGVDWPEAVQALSARAFPRAGDDFEWPDVYGISCRFPGEKFVTFEVSCHQSNNAYMGVGTGAMIYCERGSAFFDPMNNVTVYDEKSKEVRKFAANGVTTVGSLTNPTGSLDVEHVGNFVDCLRRKDPATHAPADVGVKSSFIPLAANVAAEIGETLHVDPLTGAPLTKAAQALWDREYEKGWEI